MRSAVAGNNVLRLMEAVCFPICLKRKRRAFAVLGFYFAAQQQMSGVVFGAGWYGQKIAMFLSGFIPIGFQLSAWCV